MLHLRQARTSGMVQSAPARDQIQPHCQKKATAQFANGNPKRRQQNPRMRQVQKNAEQNQRKIA